MSSVTPDRSVSAEEARAKHEEYLLPAVANYYAEPVVLDRGDGMYVEDVDGKRYLDFFGGLLTVSVGPDYDRFLLNRFGLHYSEVTAANLLLVDRHGEVLEGEGPLMNAAFVIHSVIHSRLGAQARVVLHTHQPWADEPLLHPRL